MPELRYVPIESVRVSSKSLRKLSADKVARYSALYESGREFPAISVLVCEGFYTVRDGRHRLFAQMKAGFSTVLVTVLNLPDLGRISLCGAPRGLHFCVKYLLGKKCGLGAAFEATK